MQGLIIAIAVDISAQTALLDDDRRRMFLNWLQAHRPLVEPILEDELKECLTQWLHELTRAEVLWEFRLILNEIHWWRDLDEQRPAKIIEVNR